MGAIITEKKEKERKERKESGTLIAAFSFTKKIKIKEKYVSK